MPPLLAWAARDLLLTNGFLQSGWDVAPVTASRGALASLSP